VKRILLFSLFSLFLFSGCATTKDYDAFYLLAQRVKIVEAQKETIKLQEERITRLERNLLNLQNVWQQNIINSNAKEYRQYMELKKKFGTDTINTKE
jgi:hypothetical protein